MPDVVTLLVGELDAPVGRDRGVVSECVRGFVGKQVFTDREGLEPPGERPSAIDRSYGQQNEREEREQDEAHDYRQV